MKREIAWLLAATGWICAVPLTAIAFSGGTGSSSDPYLVATATDLNEIRGTYLGSFGAPKYYRQTVNIDLSGYSNPEPIGDDVTPAYIVYDGGSNLILGLTISRPTEPYVGLFGVLSGTLRNLSVVSGSVVGSQRVGALVGMLQSGLIENCRSAASVSGSYYVGGIVGLVDQGTVRDSCQRGGTVNASVLAAGGVCGYLAAAAAVDMCYAACGVSAGSSAGGLVGVAGSSSVTDSYWDTVLSGQITSSGGGTGLATAAMKQRSSFSGWDFGSRWQLYEGNSYPYLQQFALTVQSPGLAPTGGVYVGESVAVTATCATAGATIHYTTDGTEPLDTSPFVAAGAQIDVPLPATLKAVAWVAYQNPSAVTSGTYLDAPKAATPQLSPSAGSYAGTTVVVTVTCSTTNAILRYTLDGSDPGTGTVATVSNGGSVDVPLTDPPVTLKVRAFRADLNPSEVASAAYTTVDNVGAPDFSPGGGTYVGDALSVTVTCNTAGAEIWATTDGSEPAVSNGTALVSGDAIQVPLTAATNWLMARAFKVGLNDSLITTSLYLRAAAADAPIFNPPGASSTSSHIQVVVSSGTPGALIRYTLNGIDPDGSSSSVTNGGIITVPVTTEGTTLKARAYHAAYNPSEITSALYEPAPAVATPVFTPVGGQPTGTVQITCATAGATIRYTTNGLPPAVDSTSITNGGVVVVALPGTLRARAWKSGMFFSEINTAYYGDFAGGVARRLIPTGSPQRSTWTASGTT